MSSINRENPKVASRVLMVTLERPTDHVDESTGEPDPKSFAIMGVRKNGTPVRYGCSPLAFTQISIGDGTVKNPKPPYLVDPRRRFVLCLDGKAEDLSSRIIRVDMYREQNISYGFKPAQGVKTQDKEVEVEVHEDGTIFITSFPSSLKTDEHALPIIRSLGMLGEIKTGELVAAGTFKVSKIEGRVVFLEPQ